MTISPPLPDGRGSDEIRSSVRALCPVHYLLTFSCYGARLQGGESGSVDRDHNAPGTAVLAPNRGWVNRSQALMAQEPYILDPFSRDIVLDAIRTACAFRGWTLQAAHVRSNHVHVVLDCDCPPERAMTTLKAYAARALALRELEQTGRRRWARHGSTRYLWRPEQIQRAVEYVLYAQGDPMSVWPQVDTSEPQR